MVIHTFFIKKKPKIQAFFDFFMEKYETHARDLDKPVSTHVRDAISESYISSNGYADQKIAALVNGAPGALDTLLELANAINNNKALADALQDAIGKKANQTELDTHTGNKTVHITASERNTWNAKQNAITVDGALSLISTNPIQNKVVKAALDKQTAITTEINSNLELHGTGLILGGYIDTNILNAVVKQLRIVHIDAYLGRNTYSLSINIVIATIPEGFRPAYNIYRVPVSLRNSGTGYTELGFATISANGGIIIENSGYVSSDLRNEIAINVSYVAA